MSTTVDDIASLREELLALPASTRALLARDLMDSLDSPPDVAVEQVWLELVERRLEDLKSGRVKPVPGPEALKRVRERILRRANAIDVDS